MEFIIFIFFVFITTIICAKKKVSTDNYGVIILTGMIFFMVIINFSDKQEEVVKPVVIEQKAEKQSPVLEEANIYSEATEVENELTIGLEDNTEYLKEVVTEKKLLESELTLEREMKLLKEIQDSNCRNLINKVNALKLEIAVNGLTNQQYIEFNEALSTCKRIEILYNAQIK